MKIILKLEELAEFLFALFLFYQLNFSAWIFWALLLTPDLSMVGYLVNTKVGAICYNIAHHKALAVFVGVLGILLTNNNLQLAGIILFAHSAMDRFFGYGLKYFDSFKNTHLGVIGK